MGIEELLGEVLTKVDGASYGSEKITFETASGREFAMYHMQSCCESVSVEEVIGDISDILNLPITLAEEVTNAPTPDKSTVEYLGESFTWTFYKIGTVKGVVTFRWYGTSNGYYSESVDFRGVR